MKSNNQIEIFFFIGLVLIVFVGCKHQIDPAFNTTDYPVEVAKIFEHKCATAGCHNSQSYHNAANLDLSSWSSMMKGGVSGAVVIPYQVGLSSLFQFVNTFSDLGLSAFPTMPINQPPLSRNEVQTLKDWIQNGCQSFNGEVPFSQNYSGRGKVYITNQGCDLVSIIDAESGLVIRYVKVGHDNGSTPELPHCVRVSPDGKFWYVCFTNGTYFQKFDATADTLVTEVKIGKGAWNILKISADSRYAYISDYVSDGKLVEVDLNLMTIRKSVYSPGMLEYPHGLAYTKTGDTLYITAQYGNMIYRFIPSLPKIDKISIQKGKLPVTTPQLLDPHEIIMSPDYSKYFITCQASNELRVMDAHTDTLLKVIPMGVYPLEFAISEKLNKIYVVNQEDPNLNFLGFKGSVWVVDMTTLEVVDKIYERFYQPHGIGVDDTRGLLYVSSRNADPNGPAPHHISECVGRNGFYHVIDLNTGKVIRTASELSVDPYSLDVRP